MQLTTMAFETGGRIPVRYTCDGEDLSPPLAWSGIPKGTAGFVLIMDDPDAPPGTWVHWVLFDLPSDTKQLAEGLPKTETVEGGGTHGACWGVSSYSRVGYHGPCPPPGSPHRYFFRLYALDAPLGLPAKATKEEVLEAMRGRVLAEAELTGVYGR
jgi:Raf kinase inhibitor-like YbhB/YbcL family protein